MPAATMNPTTVINTHKLQRVLLSDGWHIVKDCELTAFSVGSSPQTDYRTGLKFVDERTQKQIIVRIDEVRAYEGEFE